MRLKSRIAAIGVTAALLTGGVAVASAVPAHASGMTEYCDSIVGGYCWNAWAGGPLVKAYTPGTQNDWFQVNSLGGGYYDIEDMNTGTYIGDNNNDPNDAKAGLVGYGGWGWKFSLAGCEGITGAYIYDNFHWGGHISINDTDGSQAFLNVTSNNQCFLQRSF